MHQVGCRTGETDAIVPDDVPMVGKLLEASGYEAVHTGKWHIGKVEQENSAHHGFSTILAAVSPPDDVLAEAQTISYLKSRSWDKPLFMQTSILNPHDICKTAAGKDLVEGHIPLPPWPLDRELPPPLDNAAIADTELEAVNRFREYIGGVSLEWNELDWRRYRWAYYRFVEYADAHLRAIVNAIREVGIEEQTVIIFMSDHGEHQGAHGMVAKATGYEESVHVPCIVSWKGVTKAGVSDDAHYVNTGVDLLPTICDYAGVAVPEQCHGRSIRPLTEGATVSDWPDHAVSEAFLHWKFWAKLDGGVDTRVYVDDEFKYVCHNPHDTLPSDGMREQLFDRTHDRGEMRNLAAEQEHAPVLDRYRTKLRTWATAHNDPYIDVPATSASQARE